jgi:nucleotide-binding universal stress UspA family protein
MKLIKRILLAVDESSHSDLVAERAIAMASSFEAKVFLVYVHPKVLQLGQPYDQEVLNKYQEHAEHAVARHKTHLEKGGIDFEVLILEGDPAEMIIETARVQKCDLIVMGTRGLSNILGLTLGSVSTKVLHSAKCMVLIVP